MMSFKREKKSLYKYDRIEFDIPNVEKTEKILDQFESDSFLCRFI